MEQTTYKKILEIISEISEENAKNEYDLIKLIFNRFLFEQKEIPVIKELWIQPMEII